MFIVLAPSCVSAFYIPPPPTYVRYYPTYYWLDEFNDCVWFPDTTTEFKNSVKNNDGWEFGATRNGVNRPQWIDPGSPYPAGDYILITFFFHTLPMANYEAIEKLVIEWRYEGNIPTPLLWVLIGPRYGIPYGSYGQRLFTGEEQGIITIDRQTGLDQGYDQVHLLLMYPQEGDELHIDFCYQQTFLMN
ncbi:MAG: hypothetical protein ACTSRE_13230 [Promethearchaeota archaeon]